MPEMEALSKPPQISEMLQKFALAFRAKTFDFFAHEDGAALDAGDDDGFLLLDSIDEFLTGQKVVIVKPDRTHDSSSSKTASPIQFSNTHFIEALLASLFAIISSFEASYIQLQAAHVPVDEDTIKTADKSLVSHLRKLTHIRNWYRCLRKNPLSDLDFPIESPLETEVQENQNKLRALDTVVNRFQSDIDEKDAKVLGLKKELDKIRKLNEILTKKLLNSNSNSNSNSKSKASPNSLADVLLTTRVYDSMFHEACRSLHSFTKLLIDLMKKAGWDLDLAANSIHPNMSYAKKGHSGYAFLSYVAIGMFQGFDSAAFGLDVNGLACRDCVSNSGESNSLKHLIEHAMFNPMEVLSKNPNCEFSRFCDRKYQHLIHPAMESLIFNKAGLSSWRPLNAFYESFVKMASSIWLLHKLAYSFNPAVEIFQVDKGADYAMVYMEDVTRKGIVPGKVRPKVGFTVIPGFKIRKTIIQSKVYLVGLKYTEY